MSDTTTGEARVQTWDSLARAAGARPAPTAELRRELLLLGVGDDLYALPVERVREIVRRRELTPMPRVPSAVRGVISLRGEVLQVIDLRRRLGLPEDRDPASRRARIVVIHAADAQLAGLWVDRVSQVMRVPESQLTAPNTGQGELVEALCPLEERFVSLLDVDRLLALDEE